MKIIATTPSRISLFGGGTDISTYADLYGGYCINMAISIRHEVIFDTDNLAAEFVKGDNPEIVWKVIKELGLKRDIGFKHTYQGEIGAGLGSSGSYIVALIGTMNKYMSLNLKREDIAKKAWEIENYHLSNFTGKQDQYAAAFGGVNAFLFLKDEVKVQSISKEMIEKLSSYCLLFYTGQKREITNIQDNFKELDENKKATLDGLRLLAIRALDAILKGDIDEICVLLNKSWEWKKQSNKNITNTKIDDLYKFGLEQGAKAGKLLGSGGGGYMLFLVDPSNHKRFIGVAREKGMIWLDFSVDWNGLETKITY